MYWGFAFLRLTILYLPNLAATIKPASFTCPKCGTIASSGVASCCGRGGSWSGNCDRVVTINYSHTWDEGIRACQVSQFQIDVGQQIHSLPSKGDTLSFNAGMDTDSDEIIAITRLTSTQMSGATPISKAANMSITAPDRMGVAYEPGATSSRSTGMVTTVVTDATIGMLGLHITLPPSNRDIALPAKTAMAQLANETITLSVNRAIAKPMDNALTDMPIITSVSASINTRKFENFLQIISQIHMTLLMICYN